MATKEKSDPTFHEVVETHKDDEAFLNMIAAAIAHDIDVVKANIASNIEPRFSSSTNEEKLTDLQIRMDWVMEFIEKLK